MVLMYQVPSVISGTSPVAFHKNWPLNPINIILDQKRRGKGHWQPNKHVELDTGSTIHMARKHASEKESIQGFLQ